MPHPHASRESLAHVDAAWLRMDTPTNLMQITSLLVFRERLDYSALRKLAEERLLVHPRFRERVVEHRLGVPEWELDPSFDLDRHLHRVSLPRPGDQQALADLLGDLMSTPLDHARPLWQLHLVESYGSGSAVVARLHHCIGDGVALLGVMLGLTEEGEGVSLQQVGLMPSKPARVVDAAKQAASQALTLGRLLLLPPDSKSLLKGELGVQKRAAWSGAVPVVTVKSIASALGAKINDVLVACVAGALRTYMTSRGGYRDELAVRAMVPVFLRNVGGDHELGNHFGLVFLDLPLREPDPLERVRLVKLRMDTIKSAPDAVVSLGVLGAMGVATTEIERIGVDLFTRKASVMITNVPGPPGELHLAGRALEHIMVWAPVSGHIGLGISLLSYNGEVRMGVAADTGRIPDPEALVAAFERDIELCHARIA